MKFLLLFCLLSVFCSAFAQSHSDQHKKQSKKDIILTKVEALPEVKEWLNRKIKGGKPALIVDDPDKKSKFFSVQVGFDGEERFTTNYTLYVDRKTYQIYYMDVFEINAKNITLKQWRCWRNKPGFYNFHYYKNGRSIVVKD